MKGLSIFIAIVFIILTLGFVDVEIGYSDGSKFVYHGWLHKKREHDETLYNSSIADLHKMLDELEEFRKKEGLVKGEKR